MQLIMVSTNFFRALALHAIMYLIHFQSLMSSDDTSQNSDILSERFVRTDSTIGEMIFLSKLLFESWAVSEVDCAEQCIMEQGCVFFTFRRGDQASAHVCRGHTSVMETRSPAEASPGTQAFVFREKSEWLERTCTHHSECPATNAECYRGLCVCVPGYYYSHSRDFCITTCTEEDQQQTLLPYPKSGLYFNSQYLSNVTLQQCFNGCFFDTLCRALDYSENIQLCCLHYVTALQAPNAWSTSISDWDFYQKTCL